MCFTLVEHFIGKVPDIELNGFNDTQTGVVFCWKVFEVISIFTSVENVSLGTLNADGEFVGLHEITLVTSFSLDFQNDMAATQPSVSEGSPNIEVFASSEQEKET